MFALKMIAVGLLIIALARPQSKTSWKNITTEGIDIVLSMDISASMLAKDFKPNRLEAAKDLARKMVAAYQKEGTLLQLKPSLQTGDVTVYGAEKAKSLREAIDDFLCKADLRDEKGKGRSYLALQAFMQPTRETDTGLEKLRGLIQKKYRLATTVGYGPRFLHSTGQLHKGDGGNGLFIQITADAAQNVPIPDKAGVAASSMTFAVLIAAQALGDRQALLDAHRRVIRFHLSGDPAQGLVELAEALA